MKKQYHYLCSSSMNPVVVVLLFLLTINAGSSSSTGGGSGGSSSRKTPRKVTKKNTATTLKAVMAQYPELKSLSSEQRALQYKAYVLHMNGATSEELDQYKPVSFGWFSCCKDGDHSTGCEWDKEDYEDYDYSCDTAPSNKPNTINLDECEAAGYGTNEACCRSFPDSRVGEKDWFWESCT